MENEDITDFLHLDANLIDSFCSDKDRLVKKTVAKILDCEHSEERIVKMHLLSSLLSKIESCSGFNGEDPACAHCRQINNFRKRILDLSIHYDSKLIRINDRLEICANKFSNKPASILGVKVS